MKRKRSRVLIVSTGGTMCMKKTKAGYTPTPGYLGRLMAENPKFSHPEIPKFTVRELAPLLDSADMTPRNWCRIANEIKERYENYDGFLVIHGTDTMAYTASALSFMLENLSKPVFLTGSQIPMSELRNDALDNLLDALLILGEYGHRLSEVFVCFNHELFRGNRATKGDADAFRAFVSPNYPVVGTVGVDINLDFRGVKRLSGDGKPLSVVSLGQPTVAVLRLFPGISADHVAKMLEYPVQGVVLECFGSGTAPSRNREMMKVFEKAASRGVVIVAVCQTIRGTADLTVYETSRALRDVGVVSGFDMTTEAALAKLFFLFAKGYPPGKVAVMSGRNLRGELTPPGRARRPLEGARRRLKAFQSSRTTD